MPKSSLEDAELCKKNNMPSHTIIMDSLIINLLFSERYRDQSLTMRLTVILLLLGVVLFVLCDAYGSYGGGGGGHKRRGMMRRRGRGGHKRQGCQYGGKKCRGSKKNKRRNKNKKRNKNRDDDDDEEGMYMGA